MDSAGLTELIEEICRRFGLDGATITVAIVDDGQIADLNRRFLNHPCATDCLSFDLSDAPATAGGGTFDLVVNRQMAIRQAAQRRHSSDAELALYVTHALLHQLGFDDATDEAAAKMHGTEDEILQHFGYGAVYNTDAPRRGGMTRPQETGHSSRSRGKDRET